MFKISFIIAPCQHFVHNSLTKFSLLLPQMGAEALLTVHSVSVTMDGVASELCAGGTYERKNVMAVMPQHP